MRTRGLRPNLAAAVATLALAVGACSGPTEVVGHTGAEPGLLAAHDLDGLDPVALVDVLDRTEVTRRPADLIVSVRPDVLVVTGMDGEEETQLPLPEDGFYLSLAPYVDETHDCFFHSLTTCLGELRNQPVTVRVTELATGEVMVDEATTTYDNGFLGYWLPRDVEAVVEVTHDGRTASTVVSTGVDDPTCLTTLALA